MLIPVGRAAILITAFISSANAGPCTSGIVEAQAKLDAQIEATAKAGPYGKETLGAKLHRQPTPKSLAEAEAKLGEGAAMETAAAMLERARQADARGDEQACREALMKVQVFIARKKA
jgi:hypothetical protein